MTLGRRWGVNWVWAEIIIVYHAVWSITVPIFFAELLFPAKKDKPWLKSTGIIIFTVLFLLSSAGFYFLFLKMSGYNASWIHFLLSVLAAFVIFVIGRRMKRTPRVSYKIKIPPAFITGSIALLISVCWFFYLSQVFVKKTLLPVWLIEVSGILLIAGCVILVLGWVHKGWALSHQFSLAYGALNGIMILGLYTLIGFGNVIDIYSQSVFFIVVNLLFFLWRKRLSNILRFTIKTAARDTGLVCVVDKDCLVFLELK